jgi:4a-hydroxytetrahydrobiopterin dehydratase
MKKDKSASSGQVKAAAGDLVAKRCAPCEGGTAPLNEAQVRHLLQSLPGWAQVKGEIAKTFAFKNFYQTMAFVNATAWVSHQENHHPDLEVGYNKCRVRYSTHSVGGLSENDFICAAKVEALMAARPGD